MMYWQAMISIRCLTLLLLQVKLVDAGFIWTEPHSRRLKTKLTVQSEVFNGAILQQTFVVEYVVETHMCPDCSRAAANPNTWTAVVQVCAHCILHSMMLCMALVISHACVHFILLVSMQYVCINHAVYAVVHLISIL